MDNYANIQKEYEKAIKGLEKIKKDISEDLKSLGFFIGIIILIIGFIFLTIELYMIYKIHVINSWPIIPNAGVIVDSYMETSSISSAYNIVVASSTQYVPYYRTGAAFVYRVGNNTYFADKVSYYEPWESNAIISRIENDLFQPGRSVNLRINPRDPSEAYILNKPYDRYYRFAFSLGLFLVGLYIVFSV